MLKKTGLVTALFIAAAALLIIAFPLIRGGGGRRLTVIGEAAAEIAPDRARLIIGIETDGETARAAQAAAASRMTAVLAALKEQSIPEQRMQTRTIALQPRREYDRDGRESLRGYRSINRIEVTLDDPQKAGAILDAAVAAGANTAGEIHFCLADPNAPRAEALAEAFTDARHKAAALAEASGLRLGRAVSIIEDTPSQPGPETFTAKVGTGAATPVEPGVLTIRARVQVEFEAK